LNSASSFAGPGKPIANEAVAQRARASNAPLPHRARKEQASRIGRILRSGGKSITAGPGIMGQATSVKAPWPGCRSCAPADVGEGRGALLRGMLAERRRTLPKPPTRRPLGPTRPRPRPRGGARPKSQRHHEIGRKHRKEAPAGAQRGPRWGPQGPTRGPSGPMLGPMWRGPNYPLGTSGDGAKKRLWGPRGPLGPTRVSQGVRRCQNHSPAPWAPRALRRTPAKIARGTQTDRNQGADPANRALRSV
jgi:hypothetical protein